MLAPYHGILCSFLYQIPRAIVYDLHSLRAVCDKKIRGRKICDIKFQAYFELVFGSSASDFEYFLVIYNPKVVEFKEKTG